VALWALMFPAATFADISSTATLTSGYTLDLDTGTTGTSGGDLLWNGSTLSPQGNATAMDFGTQGQLLYPGITQAYLQQEAASFQSAPLSSGALGVNTVLGVHTNGGNYAKLLVTANSGGSISFEYTTYGATSGGGAGAPSITQLQNNYSYTLPGLPNYGIAPGSLFIIQGTGLNNQPLSALQSSAPPGLPTTFNGTSISVTVNGTTTTPGIYYTSPTQLAAVLPSTTPVGTGTITVTSGGQTSASAQIQVVQSALGIDTYYGTGTGLATVTDPTDPTGQRLIATTNSLSPGQEFVLWGSGVGADTTNNDLTYPQKQNNLSGIPMQVYIGGLQANIAYRGRSQYPGVDQVVVTIPLNVPTGCAVSILVVSGGSVVSNGVTIPVNPGGGTCSDPTSAASASEISALSGKTNVNFGFLDLSEMTISGTLTNSASGEFYNETVAEFHSTYTSSQVSIGSCTVIPPVGPVGTIPALPSGLDAGTITLSGPGGLSQTLTTSSFAPGSYGVSLPAGSIPVNGGAFTFNNGAGGVNVKGFNATVSYRTPLVWSNMSSISSVVRANGMTVTWQFGTSGTYVVIGGSSSANGLTVSFTCSAAVSAGQFTVPSAVLLALPVGSGTLLVENSTNPVTFTATGLDFGYAFASTGFQINVPYQ
jgi:uncharacterized protein (TIGR03437 family)